MFESMSTSDYRRYADTLDAAKYADDRDTVHAIMAGLMAKYGPDNDDIRLLDRYHT